ncbi:hypothetical protein LIER_36012 [Lithospermum erythrorhizon]|uniref:Uncharacterized protein n=1 Tax=Lithospermum erythrorhizon TaxID=34254 RepID=A0AAV3NZP6_LITER
MREDDFDYGTDVELENQDTGMESGPCYLEEDEAFEDMGPVLNDIGPLHEGSFEYSDELVGLVKKKRRMWKFALAQGKRRRKIEEVVEISTTTAWRAIKAAGYLMFGNEEQ